MDDHEETGDTEANTGSNAQSFCSDSEFDLNE
jgi:hypothetical protein